MSPAPSLVSRPIGRHGWALRVAGALALVSWLWSTPASAQDVTMRPLELTLDAQVPVVFTELPRDETHVGLGGAISLRYFFEGGHGIVSSLRFRTLEGFVSCLYPNCDAPGEGVMASLMAGWGYRAPFGVRPSRAVWFDATPHVGLELGGNQSRLLIGGELGIDVNLHTPGGVIFGLGGQYELLASKDRDGPGWLSPLQGGAVVIRIGGAIGP